MTTNQDGLDDAIDLVTARLTAVEADTALAGRIVSSLPERSVWQPHAWISPFAIGALATLAVIVVLRTFEDGSTGVGPAKAGHHTAGVGPDKAGHHSDSVTGPDSGHRTAGIGPAKAGHHSGDVVSAFRRTDSGTMVRDADHEFSLPAIATAVALNVDALTPSELVVEPAVVPAPLVIADLPLSSEFSPR